MMVDALCGPSNALHGFQKHSQQDRQLQQDRLISRAGPSQGFRSPAQNAGALDPEFEAFQTGAPAQIPFSTPSPAPFFQQSLPVRHHTPLSQVSAAIAAPDWALDFQRLNLASPAPSIQQNAPIQFSSSSMAPSSLVSAGPSFTSPIYQPTYSDHMMGGGYGAGIGLGYIPGHEQQVDMYGAEQQQHPIPIFDDAAFAAAFDSAAEMMQVELPQETKEKHVTFNEVEALMRSDEEFDAIMAEVFTKTGTQDNDFATVEINKSRIHEPSFMAEPPIVQETQAEQQQLPLNDGDALAQTAKQLLDSVSHETSEKFAQSSFMALMRRLRDKEVKVDGENFIDSSTNAIANTTGEASSTNKLDPGSQESSSGNNPGYSQPIVLLPSRPLTPEIDPPAPSLEAWRQRLLGVAAA